MVPVVVGIVIILMSLMTDYEGGFIKKISMSTHLTTDILAGLFLAASPWIFHFDDQVYLPHVIFGILEIGAGLFTTRASQHAYGRNLGTDMRHAH